MKHNKNLMILLGILISSAMFWSSILTMHYFNVEKDKNYIEHGYTKCDWNQWVAPCDTCPED